MFCTTFYSYKGGVGRTLALANVAAALAEKGRRVLVVDFDLEAPGLTSLPQFSAAADCPGVVDFVHQYLGTGTAPDPGHFIHTCELFYEVADEETGQSQTHSLTIDVMPAGLDKDGCYGSRLSSIDWGLLYSVHNGFLLMEDLRARWQDAHYDYVLIDSRTGHTDIGGICTRQMPDAVVAVFFPNEQNLSGLRQIVRGIRVGGARPQPIELLFVASRVPRLDDEHGHLRNWLDRFQNDLEYTQERLTVVQHYDSMMLLNQALFVLDRPASGLAREYRDVATAITGLNDEDPDGAVAFLNSFVRQRATRKRSDGDPIGLERLVRIGDAHATDFVVQYALARAFYSIRDLLRAEEACDRAIAAEGKTRTNTGMAGDAPPSARRLRLRILSEQGRSAEALEDARIILHDPKAGRTALIDAALTVATADPTSLSRPSLLPAIAAATREQLMQLAGQLTAVEGMRDVSAELVEVALGKTAPERSEKSENPTEAQLVLIAGGHFDTAAKLGIEYGRSDNLVVTLFVAFNTAIATWGRDGAPNPVEWRHIAYLFAQVSGSILSPNNLQCQALTQAVIGDVAAMRKAAAEARLMIQTKNGREFSCWTYTNVTAEVFQRHLDAIEAFGAGSGPPPSVLSRT